MNKNLFNISLFLTLGILIMIGCKEELPTVPAVTTDEIKEISQNTAIIASNITADGGSRLTTCGICWSLNPIPTIDDSITIKYPGSPLRYNSVMQNLTANTNYYIRAYVKNSIGIGYGNIIIITTLPPYLPDVKNGKFVKVYPTSAEFAGEVTVDGGAPTTRGVCWGLTENPTIEDGKTDDGEGIGNFTSNITGLIPNTTYYVRAYATNTVGTVYDTTILMRTMYSTVTDIDGNVYQTVMIGTQEWMAENLKVTRYSNGDTIPNIKNNDSWGWANTAWCSYDNYSNDRKIYGLLYKFKTIVDIRGLCPDGWHVPSDTEWTTLTDYLGGVDIAGYKLKKTGKGIASNNSSGFTGLAGGIRHYNGHFQDKEDCGFWWSSTEYGRWGEAYGRYMYLNQKNIIRKLHNDRSGLSVRCLKD
ncbi:MAG: fibrobacter succinogenes major paralogous domain-containing protein [Tenuifilaceae bacterium]